MSEITQIAALVRVANAERCFRGRMWLRVLSEARLRSYELRRARFGFFSCVAAPRVAKGEAWWSQTGSNRRPHACKARALPAELWPRNQKTNALHSIEMVGLGRL